MANELQEEGVTNNKNSCAQGNKICIKDRIIRQRQLVKTEAE